MRLFGCVWIGGCTSSVWPPAEVLPKLEQVRSFIALEGGMRHDLLPFVSAQLHFAPHDGER